MRSRSLSRKGGEMEVDKLKEETQPHLSGAYIRSLVKQLSSSRIKNPVNPASLDSAEGFALPETLKNVNENKKTQHQPEQPQQPKKQVRRRLHTSRPYQERLLNMAEARREIVTALKFHRASMKQASEQQQQQQQIQSQSNCLQSASPPAQENTDSRPYYQTSCTNYNIPGYLENQSLSTYSCPPNIYSWSCPSIASVPIADNFNIPLPNQPLGLNLSFHDFNLDTTLYQYNNENPSIYSYSSQTSSSSHTEEEAHSHPVMVAMEELKPNIVSGEGVHTGVSDSDMPEIQSTVNQQQMEWNENINIVDSAWWCQFASTMDEMKEEKGGEDGGLNIFDEIMEFPDWMNANENDTPFLQEHLENNSSDEYLEETSLPCMVIEEIDGMDGEWLA